MRRFTCQCGAELFFENVHCGRCGAEVGWCDACRDMTSRTPEGACRHAACGQMLAPCDNRTQFAVCNAFFPTSLQATGLCRSCRKTSHIPRTDDAETVRRWGLLEKAKRRLLYDLALVGVDDELLGRDPPLSFRFLEDRPQKRVMTGHADGVITVNLEEADPVRREAERQRFGEPQRTVIGHMRHEASHYLWLQLIEPTQVETFCQVFGDHRDPEYGAALEAYYQAGPPSDWSSRFISAYAAAHPWEDFAETAAFYLDMQSVLDTIRCRVPTLAPAASDFREQIRAYLAAGVALNEINRSLGLVDLVPEVVSDPVVAKLQYVHELLRGVASPPPSKEAS